MTTIVIQARMRSTRLPGKVLRDLGGQPVLAWIVRAARLADVGEVVVATSDGADDDVVAAWASGFDVRLVRGSEDDVLSRFVLALDGVADDETVVRLTADCPLLDPSLVRMAVAAFEAADLDYLSTVVERTLPRGEEVEVTTAGVLRRIDAIATGVDRVHVTSLLYREPGYRVGGVVVAPRSEDLRVTLDTPEDAEVLDELVRRLGDRAPSWREVVDVLRRDPALVALNAEVHHKAIDEG